MGKNILITGGTGFIGRALCKSLLEQKYAVTVLTRHPRRAANKFQNDDITFIGDLSEIKNDHVFNAVINLAGEPIAQRWNDKTKAKIFGSRIHTTKKLVALLKRLDHKPDVFISGSAIGWYGTHTDKVYDEQSHPSENDIGSYSKNLCQAWETEALKAQQLNIRTVLLRTGVVLEKDGGTLKELYPPFIMGVGGPIGDGQQWFSWIHRNDLIGIILHSLDHDNIEGPINGTAPNPVRNKDFAKALGHALHRPVLLPVPGIALKALFSDMAEEIMLHGQNVVPQKALDTGYVFHYPEAREALNNIYQDN